MSSEPSPSQAAINREAQAPWKGFGASVDAISFGFMATAILISLFLIMAIFEHLFRPSPTSFSSLEALSGDTLEARAEQKLGNPRRVSLFSFAIFPVLRWIKLNPIVMSCGWFLILSQVSTSYAADFSVMMPGQDYPTFIAQPAPLPCPREGIHLPPHDHNFPQSVTQSSSFLCLWGCVYIFCLMLRYQIDLLKTAHLYASQLKM